MKQTDPFTVLLLSPQAGQDNFKPWHWCRQWEGLAVNEVDAIEQARKIAADEDGWNNDLEDYNVLFVCAGQRRDITPLDERGEF